MGGSMYTAGVVGISRVCMIEQEENQDHIPRDSNLKWFRLKEKLAKKAKTKGNVQRK
jgi:hypothetical protein